MTEPALEAIRVDAPDPPPARFSWRRTIFNRRTLWLASAGLIFVALAVIYLLGMQIPDRWALGRVYIVGLTSRQSFQIPPFQPLSSFVDVQSPAGISGGGHFYLLGSDGGGRDTLALIARGALPSLELVLAVVVTRFIVGVIAGIAMAHGSGSIRALSRSMGRWFAGFPYLAITILVIQVLSPHSRFLAFVLGMAVVGWRDIAEVAAEHVESVLSQPYAEAGRALGTAGLTFFKRHVVPHLRPALALEIPFQASAVLVLLGELGFLNVYLGNRTYQIVEGRSVLYRLPQTPELGGLVAGARTYILLEQWAAVVVPGLALFVLALAFELLGRGLRSDSAFGPRRPGSP